MEKIGGMEVEEISATSRAEFIKKLGKAIRTAVEGAKSANDDSDDVYKEMSAEGRLEYIRAQQRSALKDQDSRVAKIQEAFHALMWLVGTSEGWYLKAAALEAQEMERGESLRASNPSKSEKTLKTLSEVTGLEDPWSKIREAYDLVQRMAAMVHEVTPHVIEAARKHGFPTDLAGVLAAADKEKASKPNGQGD